MLVHTAASWVNWVFSKADYLHWRLQVLRLPQAFLLLASGKKAMAATTVPHACHDAECRLVHVSPVRQLVRVVDWYTEKSQTMTKSRNAKDFSMPLERAVATNLPKRLSWFFEKLFQPKRVSRNA
ncbi:MULTISPECIES: hypothetical protein [Henriciella]|jgi:hypothetical protein|uniref:hypothetical protein n=1 Tax=Henriciella TaxID=453849 RepID=UPI00117AF947|nr:hypothetical protein [Henriciella pelagia]